MRYLPLALGVLLLCGAAVVSAGELEPPAPPGSTMKSLDEVPPTWSQKLDSTNGSTILNWLGCGSDRFDCLWPVGAPIPSPQAVLDKETGLVWERSPDTEEMTWPDAISHCYTNLVAERRGWRLPSMEELTSLQMPVAGLVLPPGNPFINVQPWYYWTSSGSSLGPSHKWAINMGDLATAESWIDSGGVYHVWCVRGGRGYYVH